MKRLLILVPALMALLVACGSTTASTIPPPSLPPEPVTHAARVDNCISLNGSGSLTSVRYATATLGCATGRGLFAVEKACVIKVAHAGLNSLVIYKRRLVACW